MNQRAMSTHEATVEKRKKQSREPQALLHIGQYHHPLVAIRTDLDPEK